jgi:hypothetical protein
MGNAVYSCPEWYLFYHKRKTLSLKSAIMNNKKTVAEIDQAIISYFICTHRLDGTKVDLDPYLREDDLIFFPVKNAAEIKSVEGPVADRYTDRMKSLFTLYREKN